jgi:DNA repair exonuclease SbcCD ATPase subunit
MSNKLTNIVDLLPEGLDESTVEKIFKLVDSTINQQVEERVTLLEAKVNAFLRTKIDQLKEQAITELTEESEVFRNAKLFESVRTLMSLELNTKDEVNMVSEMKDQHSEMEQEVTVLTEQLNKVILENEKLQNTIKILNNKVHLSESKTKTLEKGKIRLEEKVQNLQAVIDEPFASSEKAIMISEANRPVENKNEFLNQFLSPEAMKLMPFSR